MASPALTFQNLRVRLFRNSMTILLGQSWWRVLTIIYCCAIIWVFLFFLASLALRMTLGTRRNINIILSADEVVLHAPFYFCYNYAATA